LFRSGVFECGLAMLAIFAPVASADAEPAVSATDREPRYLFDLRHGHGVNAFDRAEYGVSWSLAAGVRVMPRIYATATLGHHSPFRDSLAEDLLLEWLIGDEVFDPDLPDPDASARSHQTSASVGVRVLATSRLWIEADLGGSIVYQVNDTAFDDRAQWVAGAIAGYAISRADDGDSEQFSLSLLAFASFDPARAELSTAGVGVGIGAALSP
jgi:hypothetical protein